MEQADKTCEYLAAYLKGDGTYFRRTGILKFVDNHGKSTLAYAIVVEKYYYRDLKSETIDEFLETVRSILNSQN